MIYKKNDIVRIVSEQPSAHIIRMFGHYQGLKPEDATADEYLARIKNVVGDGRAYVVTTISSLRGFICILNPDEVIGSAELSELSEDEKEAYYERRGLEAPNVYDNDPSDLKPTWSVQHKCKAVTHKAMRALFPDAMTRGFELFGCYDYRLEKYLADLDWCFEHFANRQPKKRKAELLRKKDELKAWFREMRFKEYYTICLGVREDATKEDYEIEKAVHEMLTKQFGKEDADRMHRIKSKKVVKNWLIAIDLNFEEVCILRNTKERSEFDLFLGCEHKILYEAKINYAGECIKQGR